MYRYKCITLYLTHLQLYHLVTPNIITQRQRFVPTHLATCFNPTGGTLLKVLTLLPTFARGEKANAEAPVATIVNTASFLMMAMLYIDTLLWMKWRRRRAGRLARGRGASTVDQP
eukprot:scaffold4049_cov204-Alexandrium_tamarense.AAC.6